MKKRGSFTLDSLPVLLYVLPVILVAFSAFFSGTETAVSSVNRIRMKNMAANGDSRAKKVLHVSDDYDRTISSILIGNNIVNIASASVGTVIFTYWFGAAGSVISTAVMTLVVLIFGEVLPKAIAKENAEKFALAVVNTLEILIKLFTPLSFLLMQIKRLVARNSGESMPSVTEEELKVLIEESENEGVLEEQESDLVRSALDFDDTTVEEILTPRVDVSALDIEDDVASIQEFFFHTGYSRIPVYEENIDHILGILHCKDFFEAQAAGSSMNLRSMLRKVLYVPPQMHISELLKKMQQTKAQMAVVVDSYGGTLGIVTLEDIIEELVGEIWDESDEEEIRLMQISKHCWRVAGDLAVVDFLDEIDSHCLEKERDELPVSFAAWALDIFKHIPEVGEHFCWHDLQMTVLSVYEQRIRLMEVKQLDPPKTEEEEDS